MAAPGALSCPTWTMTGIVNRLHKAKCRLQRRKIHQADASRAPRNPLLSRRANSAKRIEAPGVCVAGQTTKRRACVAYSRGLGLIPSSGAARPSWATCCGGRMNPASRWESIRRMSRRARGSEGNTDRSRKGGRDGLSTVGRPRSISSVPCPNSATRPASMRRAASATAIEKQHRPCRRARAADRRGSSCSGLHDSTFEAYLALLPLRAAGKLGRATRTFRSRSRGKAASQRALEAGASTRWWWLREPTRAGRS